MLPMDPPVAIADSAAVFSPVIVLLVGAHSSCVPHLASHPRSVRSGRSLGGRPGTVRLGHRVRHGPTVMDRQPTVIASSPVTSPPARPVRSSPRRASPLLSGRGGSLGSECGRNAPRVAAVASSGVHLSPPSDEWPIRAAISKPAFY